MDKAVAAIVENVLSIAFLLAGCACGSGGNEVNCGAAESDDGCRTEIRCLTDV
jgi:hypothetical protein